MASSAMNPHLSIGVSPLHGTSDEKIAQVAVAFGWRLIVSGRREARRTSLMQLHGKN